MHRTFRIGLTVSAIDADHQENRHRRSGRRSHERNFGTIAALRIIGAWMNLRRDLRGSSIQAAFGRLRVK